MRRFLPVFWLFLVLSALLPLSGWGQEYKLRKVLGEIVEQNGDIQVDGRGNIYALEWHSIVKMTSSGKYIARFGKSTYFPINFAVDNKGNSYVISNDSFSPIEKFDTEGNFITYFYLWKYEYNRYATDIAVDGQGNMYVTDNKNPNTIQKFDSKGVFLFQFGETGTLDAQLNGIVELVADIQGNLYVADNGNRCIKKFDPAGKFLLKIDFSQPFKSFSDIAIDTQGNIYDIDVKSIGGSWAYYAIRKFDTTGKMILNLSFSGAEGMRSLAADGNGNIYVVERSTILNINKYDSAGNLLDVIGRGKRDGQFYNPQGIALDSQGNLYVVDSGNNRIQKFDPAGKFLMKTGSSGTGDGQFSSPQGIALDSQGNMYVVDRNNNRIQKLDPAGKFLMKTGSYGIGDGQLNWPKFITLDSQGNLYVVDSGNNRIQKFDPAGKFLMKTGSSGTGDGQFYSPCGIVLDIQGNIYVVDAIRSHINKFDPTGRFLTRINFPMIDPNHFVNLIIDANEDIYFTHSAGVFIYEKVIPSGRITGRIFDDTNQNCIQDANEKGLPNIVIAAKPGNYYGITDQTGNYSITVDIGTYTVSQIIQNTSSKLIEPTCPANNTSSLVTVKAKGDIISNINFANRQSVFVPYLSSTVVSNRRRRCFINATIVSYVNQGNASADNVKVYVQLPKYVTLKSADKPYVLDKDSNYVFTIGTLKAGETGKIQIKDSVACQRGITGLTVCSKAWITPANSVIPKSSWDQSDITLSGRCIENGRVRFVLINSGQGSMADSSEFRLLLDAKISLRKNFKLAKGDSLVLRIPANGKTVRLEANQRPDHPRKSQSNLTLEGCVASASEVVSKGFVDVLPQDDAEPEVSVDCQRIIDSYDPNDKQVSPIGTTTQHFTPTTASLKYLIRFQNTGSDTAYTVVLVDTLSEHLDIATLEVQGSSHPYKLGVSGKGRPVLSFTFNNINLPDSTRNQLGSNGFIQFSITPNAGLAEKTLIENFADIYFDYNDPIRTNTTTNRIYDVPPVVDVVNALPVNEVVLRKPQIATLAAALIDGKTTITIDGNYFEKVADKNTVTINGIQATVIEASEGKLVVTIPTPKDPISGKVTVRTDGGEAISELELVLGNEEAIALRGVKLYPNPSSGRVTLDFTQTQERITKVVVYNSVGKQILVVVPQGKTQLVSELNLTPYGTGMYLISIQAKDKQLTRKLVIR